MSNHLKWNRPKLSGFTWWVTRCQLNSISFVVSKQQRPHWWRTIKGCSSRTCFFKRESLLISFSSKHTLSQYLQTTWVWYWVWAPTAFWNAILILVLKLCIDTCKIVRPSSLLIQIKLQQHTRIYFTKDSRCCSVICVKIVPPCTVDSIKIRCCRSVWARVRFLGPSLVFQ